MAAPLMQIGNYYRKFRIWGAGLKGPWRYQLARPGGSPNAYLKLCYGGVIHVGANYGQEIPLYSENKLKVVWIEANPTIYEELQRSIKSIPNQRALNYLITDRDGDNYKLHISNNFGLSSSIFDLHQHKDIWPDVHYVNEIMLESRTLETALHESKVPLAEYEVLVMDTQGSELMVLKGAAKILSVFRYIKTEAADFEVYKNCCTVDQITSFLELHGFSLLRKDIFAERAGGGACFELLFRQD